MLLFLLLFSIYFGVPWKIETFGIALGLSFYGVLETAAFAILAQFRAGMTSVGTTISAGGYICAMLIWLAYCLKTDTIKPQFPHISREALQSQQAFVDLLRR